MLFNFVLYVFKKQLNSSVTDKFFVDETYEMMCSRYYLFLYKYGTLSLMNLYLYQSFVSDYVITWKQRHNISLSYTFAGNHLVTSMFWNNWKVFTYFREWKGEQIKNREKWRKMRKRWANENWIKKISWRLKKRIE